MSKIRITCILTLVCMACSSSEKGLNDSEQEYDPNKAFNNFPDSLFNGIYINQSTTDAQADLIKNGFELVDSSGSFYYVNRKDSSEVIIPGSASIRSLKIILKSKDQLYLRSSLQNGFLMVANHSHIGPGFSVHHYQQEPTDFKVTIFEQDDFIRLHFEAGISR